MCSFSDGYLQGDRAYHVENIDSENTCAVKVKEKYPDALGATWYDYGSCWADYGYQIIHSYSHRTCLFGGIWFQVFISHDINM